jgi:hypothetical protein
MRRLLPDMGSQLPATLPKNGAPFLYDNPAGGDTKPPITFDDVPVEKKTAIETAAIEAFKAKLPKVPEKYTIQLPKDSHLDEKALERTAAIARQLGLTEDAKAQEIANFAAAEVADMIRRTAESQTTRARAWEEEALKASDIGAGSPEKLQAHLARTKKLLEKFFPEGARKLIDDFGLGNNPDFLRGLTKLGVLMKEDDFIVGDSSGKRTGSAASRIYGKSMGQNQGEKK